MNFFESLLLFLPFFKNTLDPLSNQNSLYKSFYSSLYNANLKPLQIEIRNFKDEIEFQLEIEDNKSTKVIVSTKKDPEKQIIYIKKLQKIAENKKMNLTFIDLSTAHPYATFQNP